MGGQILRHTYGERWIASNFGTSVPSHHVTRAYRHQTLALPEPLLVEKWSKSIAHLFRKVLLPPKVTLHGKTDVCPRGSWTWVLVVLLQLI